MMALEKKDWTLLALALADGKPLSPVQLQKVVFLFQKMMPANIATSDYYNFTPYNYGPFCSAVYDDANALAEEGLAKVGLAAPQGYRDYSATPQGVAAGTKLAATLSSDTTEYASKLVEWVIQQSFAGLVSAIYEKFPEYKVNSVFRG